MRDIQPDERTRRDATRASLKRTPTWLNRIVVAAAVGLASFPLAAAAQPTGHITLNGGGQFESTALSEDARFREHVEDGRFTARADLGAALLIDAGVALWPWHGLGLGVSASRVSSRGTASFTIRSPHPFFFERPRTVSGSADLERITTGVHVMGVYRIPAGDRLTLLVQGGPSIFNVRQDFVVDVTATERFPFDTLVDPRPDVQAVSETAFGYNAGVDLGLRIGRRWGLGALIRYSRASADFAVTGARLGERSLELDIGGLQIGGGLRLTF